MTVTEKDIEYVTLRSVLVDRPYNDLGLLVRGSLFFCSEAQSTWSVNVLVRMFLYLAETYHEYIKTRDELDIYGSKRIFLPIPYCCLLYSGRGEMRPEVLSLAKEFFGENSPLDLKVEVICKGGTDNIAQQYIRFCHIFDEQV